MTRVVWLTDIHLNFVPRARVESFLRDVREREPDTVLIGGDIAESHNLLEYLAQLDEALSSPIYFVLGNHDYYFGSIDRTRAAVTRFCADRPGLCYLTVDGVAELAPNVGLVGHDGWADARLGDYERSVVTMYDYKLIEDLAGLTKADRWPVLQRFGDEAADHVRQVLPEALDRYAHVVLLTHVPPLREACWHEGQLSDDQWAPHFTCRAMGDAILETMRSRADRRLTVLCGHTHGVGETRPLPNVDILTGGAQYGDPEIQRIFEFF